MGLRTPASLKDTYPGHASIKKGNTMTATQFFLSRASRNLSIALLSFLWIPLSSFAATISNPEASLTARQVLAYIATRPLQTPKEILSGQHLSHHSANTASGYNAFITALNQATEKKPTIIGADYGQGSAGNLSAANQVLINHWNEGGLVQINLHADNPWTGGNAWDIGQRNLEDLMTSGNAAYTSWHDRLDVIATALEELRDAGVVVLFRPFHEMNFREAFWWDMGSVLNDHPAQGLEVWKDFWRYHYDYFTNDRKLNNLIWVYAPANYDHTGWNGVDWCYPGEDYVDIVGVDIYDDNAVIRGQAYQKLTALGKPFAFTEFGPLTRDGSYDNRRVLQKISADYPLTAYVLHWHSWNVYQDGSIVDVKKVAIIDNAYASEFMSSTVDLDTADWLSSWNYDLWLEQYFPDALPSANIEHAGRPLDLPSLYAIGGDPLDPSNWPALRLTSASDDISSLNLEVKTNQNRSYQLKQSSDLDGWTNWGSPTAGTGHWLSLPLPPADDQLFFRVSVSEL